MNEAAVVVAAVDAAAPPVARLQLVVRDVVAQLALPLPLLLRVLLLVVVVALRAQVPPGQPSILRFWIR